MAGYIGKSQGVTQVDGYNRTEADDRYVNASGDTMTGGLNGRSFITADDTNNYALVAGRYSAGYGGAVINTTSNASFLELQVNGFGGLRADSAGRVTMPYQPAFRATSDNTGQSLTNLTNTVVIFKVAETNIGGHYNTSNGKFTAPVSGFYTFNSSLLITNGGATRMDLVFYVNGTPKVAHEFRDGGAVSTNASVTAGCEIYLSTNDYVEVITALHGASGSIYSEPKFWNFSGYLIG